MNRYNARDVYQLTKQQMWDFESPAAKFVMVFDDGEMVVEREATIYSHYCAIFNRLYPQIPCLKKSHMGSDRLTKKTFNNLLAFGRSLALDYHTSNRLPFDNTQWSGLIYDVEQDIYNETVNGL